MTTGMHKFNRNRLRSAPPAVAVVVVPLAEPARSTAIARAARLRRVVIVWEKSACR